MGTDIGIDAVKKAKQAVFGKRAMNHVPESYRRRFFKRQDKDDLWAAKPELTRWTKFRPHNLLEPLDTTPFDVIFLKNVLIYFDRESKKVAVEHLVALLRPGGVLVTAASEGISDFVKEFERVSASILRKP